MNTNPEQQRIGKSMLWIFWVLVLGGLVLLFGNWEEKQINPNSNIAGTSNESSRTITLKQNRFGHYVASGRINSKGVTFMLDTGATDVAVPAALAEKLGLVRGRAIQVMTANGVARAYQTQINTLMLGDISLTNVRAAITPGMRGKEVLLGMSALAQLDFSQSGDVLTLTQYLN